MNRLVLFLLGLLLLTGCNDDEKDDSGNGSFDRQAMLKSYVEKVIVPTVQAFSDDLSSLLEKQQAFSTSQSSESLEALRQAFLASYTSWQGLGIIGFGPASDEILISNLNTFPADTQKINSAISSGDYNLSSASMLSAKGLPALDYLLYSDGTEQVLAKLSQDNHKVYLKSLVEDMVARTSAVKNKWLSEDYQKSFIENDGTDAGSSTSFLVNHLNIGYERIKNNRLGIPLGKKSLGEPFPDKVELYHQGESVDLIKRSLEATLRTFKGDGLDGSEGIGLDDHLDHLGASHGSTSLSSAIVAQLEQAIGAVDKIDGSLSSAIDAGKPEPEQAYKEIQKALILLKTDMPSALSIAITYLDNDGD